MVGGLSGPNDRQTGFRANCWVEILADCWACWRNLIFGLFVAFGNQSWLKFDHRLQATLYLQQIPQQQREGDHQEGVIQCSADPWLF